MNLAEILVYTDIGQLHQIASHYGCQCNPHSKNDLITTLLSNIRRKATIQAELQRLTSTELHFLFLLFFDKRVHFQLEDVIAKAGVALDCSAEKRQENPRKYVAGALKRGWLFPVANKPVGDFRVAQDMREPYLQIWIEQWRQTAAEVDAEPTVYRDEGTAMCDDLMQFLRFLAPQPIPLTAEGGMYKRYQTQLFRQFSIKEEPLAQERWRFGYGLHFDLYPDRFSLLYDYCYYQRWIEEYPDRVEITQLGLVQLSQPVSPTLHFELIRFWLRLYKRAIPNLPMLVPLIALLAGGSWISHGDLAKTLLPWIKPFYYDAPDNILRNRIIKMMIHLGLVRASLFADEQWHYSSTSVCQSWLRECNGFTESTIMLK